jgi:hypothetical protein
MTKEKLGLVQSLYYPLESPLIETKENKKKIIRSQTNEINEDLVYQDKTMKHVLVKVEDNGEIEVFHLKGLLKVNKKINKHKEFLTNPLLKDPKKRGQIIVDEIGTNKSKKILQKKLQSSI